MNHRRAGIFLVEPEDLTVGGTVSAHTLRLIGDGVARHAARFDDDIVLRGVTQPRAEHLCLGAPNRLTGPEIKHLELWRILRLFAATFEAGFLRARNAIDGVKSAAAHANRVVAKAAPRRGCPQHRAGMAIHYDEMLA